MAILYKKVNRVHIKNPFKKMFALLFFFDNKIKN